MSERSEDATRIDALGDGRFCVHRGHTVTLAYAVADGQKTWVWLDGSAHLIEAAEPERVSRSGTDDTALAAPMPATVRAIPISIGQQVSAGDVLVVLEAMKMELAVKAPRDGRVRAIRCVVGELVQAGVPLAELEPQ